MELISPNMSTVKTPTDKPVFIECFEIQGGKQAFLGCEATALYASSRMSSRAHSSDHIHWPE